MKQYKFKFDRRFLYGSLDNFFHFMWGYMLPSISEVNKINSKNVQYFYEDCGPVINKIIHEFSGLLKLNYKILNMSDFKKTHAKTITVNRWDIYAKKIKPTRKCRAWYRRILTRLHYKIFRVLFVDTRKNSKYLIDIENTRKDILRRVESIDFPHEESISPKFILKRSKSPEYYKEGGKAEYNHYGTSIRALVGVEKTIDSLQNDNLHFSTYEPGKHTICHQVQTFYNAETVFGIRGAEVANMFWMKPGSTLIIINPIGMSASIAKDIAKILNINYIEINTEQGFYPDLSTFNLKEYLNK